MKILNEERKKKKQDITAKISRILISVLTEKFAEQQKKYNKRSLQDQRVIGDLLTVIEQELKDEFKSVLKNI